MFFKFPEWLEEYLDYLPTCCEGMPERDRHKKLITYYMNIDLDAVEDHEYNLCRILRAQVYMLIELHNNGKLI